MRAQRFLEIDKRSQDDYKPMFDWGLKFRLTPDLIPKLTNNNSYYSREILGNHQNQLFNYSVLEILQTIMKKQVPQDWFCPISQEIMKDPVIGPDGFTYERKFIEEWLEKSNTSPVTRKVFDSKNLIPNLALKSTIENMLPDYLDEDVKSQSVQKKQGQIQSEEDELILDIDSTVVSGEVVVNVTIQSPVQQAISKRKSAAIICVIDVSGSMDTEAVEGTKGMDENGFTRLDLVKHSINTIIETLGDEDMLALVPFSNAAHINLDLTKMNKKGKLIAKQALKNIKAGGSTNIWDGIRIGLGMIKDQRCNLRNTSVILLTDGQPNINPPQGVLPTIKKFMGLESIVANIHVFGYGYNLDTVLLTGIATMGFGTYGYIPDCSMVGTIFINFLSNILATITNSVQIRIQPSDGISLLSSLGKTEPVRIMNLGAIQYGQKRNVIFRLSTPKDDSKIADIFLNYGFGLRKQKHLEFKQVQTKSIDNMESQINRMTHIESLLKALGLNNKLPEAQSVIQNLLNKLRNSPVAETDQLTKLIIRDIVSENDQEGQVTKAFEKADWYSKWGKHYIPSLILAHIQQVCTNFKDPGLQSYGAKLFKDLQNQIDTIFIKLPPPEPTVKKQNYVAPANMSNYYNYYGGCIDGACNVEMPDGSCKKVKNLKKGDLVKTPNGSSKILCVLKTSVNDTIPMIHFPRGLVITPYHPVMIDREWYFPKTIGRQSNTYVQDYYNFVLEKDHIMLVDGIKCVSLGHGLKGSAIIQHDYLGTNSVLRDLQSHKSWDNEVMEIGGFIRDPQSNRITKIMIR